MIMPPTEVPCRPIRLKICIQGAAQARSTSMALTPARWT